jgi:hypothetical protein
MNWLVITSAIGLLLYFPFSELEQNLKTIEMNNGETLQPDSIEDDEEG